MSETLQASKWIRTFGSSDRAPLRLFCFPYLGGSASVFRPWPRRFNDRIELCAVQLPGRENRIGQKPFTDMRELVAAIADEIGPHVDEKPFAFFGYSLGAIVAFELTRELRRRGLPQPRHLFVAASSAPQIAEFSDPPRSTLSKEELIAELRRLGGTPEEVLSHEELLEILLPLVRADFSILDTYRYADADPLDLPISAFGGVEDTDVPRERLEAWSVQTSAPFTVRIFPGGHFFLHAQEMALTEEIWRLLQ
jgi:medium-chain acyl-[acyl-carrier-protein] hydrolase